MLGIADGWLHFRRVDPGCDWQLGMLRAVPLEPFGIDHEGGVQGVGA